MMNRARNERNTHACGVGIVTLSATLVSTDEKRRRVPTGVRLHQSVRFLAYEEVMSLAATMRGAHESQLIALTCYHCICFISGSKRAFYQDEQRMGMSVRLPEEDSEVTSEVQMQEVLHLRTHRKGEVPAHDNVPPEGEFAVHRLLDEDGCALIRVWVLLSRDHCQLHRFLSHLVRHV